MTRKRRMGKRELYLYELRKIIASHVTLKGFGKQNVANAIRAKEEFEKTQTILKRPTKIRKDKVWGFCAAAWIELLLDTDYHSKFKSYEQLKTTIWHLLVPVGYLNHISTDTEWIKLMNDYERDLRNWYYKSHQEEKEAIDLATALVQMRNMNDGVKSAMFRLLKEGRMDAENSNSN